MSRGEVLTKKRITPAVRLQWLADVGGWEFKPDDLMRAARQQVTTGEKVKGRGVNFTKRLRRAYRREYYRRVDELILESQKARRANRAEAKAGRG